MATARNFELQDNNGEYVLNIKDQAVHLASKLIDNTFASS